MAFAIQCDAQLSNQLRFLLFEVGLGFSPSAMDTLLIQASNQLSNDFLRQLRQECLPIGTAAPLDLQGVLEAFQQSYQSQRSAARFFQWRNLKESIQQTLVEQCLKLAWRMQQNARSVYPAHHSQEEKLTSALNLSQMAALYENATIANQSQHRWSIRDTLQYSAAFKGTMHLPWLAIPKIPMDNLPGLRELQPWLAKAYPNEQKTWYQKLIAMRYDPSQYYAFPMHVGYWKQMRRYNRIMQTALPVLMDTKMHVVNTLGHLSPWSPKGNWLRYCMPTATTTTLDTLQCNRLNQRLHSYHSRHKLSLLPVLNKVTITSESRPTLNLIVQENPNHYVQSNAVYPLNAVITPEILNLGDVAPHRTLSLESDFTQLCSALIFPSLKLLFSDRVALSLNPNDCLISWDKPYKRISILVMNTEIHAIKARDTTSQEAWKALIAHWQTQLIQTTIRRMIEQLEKRHSLTSKTLWQKVRALIEMALSSITHPQKAFFSKQVLEMPWPSQAILTKALNPRAADYLYNNEENKLKTY